MAAKTNADRAQVLAETAERISLANEFRSDDFQDEVVRLVNGAREHWRDEHGELPRFGADPTYDALIALADAAESSPIAVRDAAERAFHVAEERVKVAR